MRVNIDKRKRPVRKGFPAETCWNLPAGSYSEPARFPWLRQLEGRPIPSGAGPDVVPLSLRQSAGPASLRVAQLQDERRVCGAGDDQPVATAPHRGLQPDLRLAAGRRDATTEVEQRQPAAPAGTAVDDQTRDESASPGRQRIAPALGADPAGARHARSRRMLRAAALRG